MKVDIAKQISINSFKDKDLLNSVFELIRNAAEENKFEVILKYKGGGVGPKIHNILTSLGYKVHNDGANEICSWYK